MWLFVKGGAGGLNFLKMFFFFYSKQMGREGVGREGGGASGETQGETELDGIDSVDLCRVACLVFAAA